METVGQNIERPVFPRASALLFAVLIAAVALPIFSVGKFINLDGTAHLHSASIMLDLIRSGSSTGGPFVLNPVPVPNSAGHWLQVLLLTAFSAFATTKLTLVLIYAAFVGSIVSLRKAVSGTQGLNLAILFAGVIGLNWLWLVGTYSFLIGLSLMFGVFALFVTWNAELTWKRTVYLAGLLLVVYFSHLIAFALLIMSMAVYCVAVRGRGGVKTLVRMGIAAAPILLFVPGYVGLSKAGGEAGVTWRFAEKGFTFSALLEHVRSFDAFSLISRRAFPLVENMSDMNGIAAPVIWIASATGIAIVATVISIRQDLGIERNRTIAFGLLFVLFAAVAVLAPDEIGRHGGVLRPRFVLMALAVFIAIMNFGRARILGMVTQVILSLVFVYQAAALYDYGSHSEATANEFFAAARVLRPDDRIASVVVLDPSPRSISHPEMQLSSLLGTVDGYFVWDNYELGYYQFPLIANDAATRDFISKLNFGKVYHHDMDEHEMEEALSGMNEALSMGGDKIDAMLLWGHNERVERLLFNWFDSSPVYADDKIRVFRRINSATSNQ
jgi:hypothetical protein